MNKDIYINKGDMQIACIYRPRKKKPCLYVYSTTTKSFVEAATFKDDTIAGLFMRYVFAMIDGESHD